MEYSKEDLMEQKEEKTVTEKRQEKESTISPWRVRDYRSWFVADTASALGTTIGGFAFTLVAYAVSHDVTTAGMVGTVFALCEGLGTEVPHLRMSAKSAVVPHRF